MPNKIVYRVSPPVVVIIAAVALAEGIDVVASLTWLRREAAPINPTPYCSSPFV